VSLGDNLAWSDRLLQWREIGGIHVDGIHVAHNIAVIGLGIGYDLFPIGVVAEGVPIFLGGLDAGMGENEDQSVLGFFGVLRNPVANALDAVALEDLNGVIAEVRFEGFEFAVVASVGPHFKNTVLRSGET